MRYRKFNMIEEGLYAYDHTGHLHVGLHLPPVAWTSVFGMAKCKPGDVIYIGDIYWEYEGGTYCQADLTPDQMEGLYAMAVKAEKAAAGVA